MNKLITRISILVVLFISVFSTRIVFAQNQANVWYFGAGTGLLFNGTTPTTLTNGPNMSGATGEGEACTTISDQNGNLLFFSDGDNVYDVNRTAMPNGTGMAGCFTATQSALIIAQPGSVLMPGGYPRFYYIFTIDCVPPTGTGLGLRYSIVDMTLKGNGTIPAPLGDVVAGSKNILIQTGVTEGLVAIPHFNGTDTWIIARGSGTGNTYYAAQVSSGGVAAPVASSAGFIPLGTSTYIMKSNPCYNMVAITYHDNWQPAQPGPPVVPAKSANCFEILKFDNSTGLLSSFPTDLLVTNVIQLANSSDYRGVYGIEWSPSGRYLYVSELVDNMLYQYDVYAGGTYPGTVGTLASIMASQRNLGTGPTVRTGHVQLGPNGRIYTAQHTWGSGTSYVGEVASPDLATATWNSTAYSYSFSSTGKWVCMGLPTLPKSFTAGKVTIGNLTSGCTGSPISLSYTYLGTVSSQTWSSTGGVFASSPTIPAPTVTYATPGIKTIDLSVVDATCGYTSTDTKQITVYNNVTSAGTVSCTPIVGNVTSPNGAYTYVWYSDAAATNPIATGTTNVSLPITGTGNVYLMATSSSSSSPTALTNGASGGHPWGGSDAGTTHTMGFTVNKAPLTFGTFDWEAPYGAWAASNQNTTFSVTLKNVSSGIVYYTTTRTVASNGPSWVSGYPFTETVNASLPLGNYQIVISATSGVGGPIKTPSTCTSSQADTKSALTYASSGVCGIGSDFTYSLNQITTTPLPCSQITTLSYNCPLPVSWLSFTANRTSQTSSVLLNWSTASEKNSKVFYVQRSLDGISFETIGQVVASGNSSDIQSYQYTDATAPLGTVYYRLLQEDYNGDSTYSSIENVNSTDIPHLSLVPNPGNGNFKIIGMSQDVKLDVMVYSVTGQSLLTTTTSPGEIVDLSELAKGFYIVKIVAGTSVQSIRFLNQ